MRFDDNPLYAELKAQHARLSTQGITQLFDADADRVKNFSLQAPYVFLDYSKNLVDQAAMDALLKAAEATGLKQAIAKLCAGEKINNTEQRPALHTALRDSSDKPILVDGENVKEAIHGTLEQMSALAEKLHSGEHKGATGKAITQLVSIGIGGSYLGPKTVVDALPAYHKEGLETFFVANVDGGDLAQVLKKLRAEECIFLIQSKSFTTLETLENAISARSWLAEALGSEADLSKHLFAVTSNVPAAIEFGLVEENILPMWDWVGGRYSLWSAIGFPIVFQLGMENFKALLRGAEGIDQHFQEADLSENLPVVLALLGIWYRNFFDYESYAVIPYAEDLNSLPGHLQQLDMESNGKQVDRDGKALSYVTGPIVWGSSGTNGQHAYHQLLHQGKSVIPVDFIVFSESDFKLGEHHAHLQANCLAQSQALMEGRDLEQVTQELLAKGLSKEAADSLAPHKVIPGNKPSNTLVLDVLNPAAVGALVALYEHKVFVQGWLWHINSFDQWGVELGKVLEANVFAAMKDGSNQSALDPSTASLIELLK